MSASQQEIHRRLLSWLKAQNFDPVVEDNANVFIRLQGEIGNWQCRIIVEDSYRPLGNPAVIHFVSRMPIRIPRTRIEDTAVMLHSLSRYMRFGHLSMDSKERRVFYHISLTLDDNSKFEKTFELALRQSVFHMDEHVGFLCFFCFNSELNHKRANYHLEASGLGTSKFIFPGNLDDYHSDWIIGKQCEDEA